jgi:hypothetical protein
MNSKINKSKTTKYYISQFLNPSIDINIDIIPNKNNQV